MSWQCRVLLQRTLILCFSSVFCAAADSISPKIYLSIGMHVNTYHSYRDDTPTEKGHGKDLRILRKILSILESSQKNSSIRKKPIITWDLDNVFTLEKVLPEEAPDIINAIKARVLANQDDVIVMSYNNGLASAMTNEELERSISWAISNPLSSGIKDIFGKFSAIVRPQEMMFSPGQGRVYKSMGLKAIQLYYSSVPFDAFRLFEPGLKVEAAYNPLRYKNEYDEFVIIPTYNIGDLIEHGSLKKWLHWLRKKQLSGEIKRDLLLAINFDADVDFWTGDLAPWYLRWLPNSGGLAEIIKTVNDLDFVEFVHLEDYLARNPPSAKVSFTQDTADGSFEGYASWSDKLSSQELWSCVEQSRQLERSLRSSLSKDPELSQLFDKHLTIRLRLLSTTHFGMATPFLINARLEAGRQLCKDLKASEEMLRIREKVSLSSFIGKAESSVKPTPLLPLPQYNSYKLFSGGIDLEMIRPMVLENGNLVVSAVNEQKTKDLKTQDWWHSGDLRIKEGVVGKYSFHLQKDDVNNVYWVESEIHYPRQETLRNAWTDVLPFELALPIKNKSVQVYRVGMDGVLKKYSLATENERDSVNHHVVDWLFGVQIEEKFFWIFFDKKYGHLFAPVPLRIRNQTLYMNPFGVYSGKQPKKSFDISGIGREFTLHMGEQFASSAPTFNGGFQRFSFGLASSHKLLNAEELNQLRQVLERQRSNTPKADSLTRMSPHLVQLEAENANRKVDTLPLRLQLRFLKEYFFKDL